MPLNKDVKKVLVIGSGPIVIGQAAEFDYAGTQCCRALREDGIEIVLINSNPATIMTDKTMADKIYIEPLNLETIRRVIEQEKPDSLLAGFGGQNGLTMGMQLAKEGFLDKHNVKLLGVSLETIDKAEDRQLFKDTMESINQPCIPSKVVNTVVDAVDFTNEIGYPVIIRPAFTLGGSGGGIVYNEEELLEVSERGLKLSPITQILVEKCISGWKEIEFEVIRDSKGNAITVCSMENVDPVGIHTGDSIVVAPAVTLSETEFQMLRKAALNIVTALGVEGACNCQFALHPDSFEYAVIEVNPRVSRSSALASKATGYPIAKVAAKIAVGYTLDEIKNAVTGTTFAACEPTIDYICLKFPKWPFDKFVYADRRLGTQMKATGEVMSIADSFEEALMKAVRGVEISVDTMNVPKMKKMSTEELELLVTRQTDERIFVIYELLKRGTSPETIHDITKIDMWFLNKFMKLVNFENEITDCTLTYEQYKRGKKLGYTDAALKRFSGHDFDYKMTPVYKMVDTCAGEYHANTPYFYATYNLPEEGGKNDAAEFIGKSGKQSVIVIGAGPIRIGQGIEFDYASVHCVNSLRKMGYEAIIINNNPETVSTDFDTGDRLYFEPLCAEDVLNIIAQEKPIGVVVAFGGQTAIKLNKVLEANGVKLIGSSADTIDMAEDRERFENLLESLNIARPKGHTVMTEAEALAAANDLGYPVLMRPSYVLGGQNMIIASSDDEIKEYMAIILRTHQDNPVLIDKYISGIEVELDAICDGEEILVPGIMEHVERTGIHSGDSIAIYPAQHVSDEMAEVIYKTTYNICKGLNAVGLVNIQYIIKDDELYVIEVNPRASRTVPYISKVTDIPMCDLATGVSLGKKLSDYKYGTGIYRESAYIAVKVPVFSFEKLTDVDTQLGPEMKSTGEVLGIGNTMEEALYKGLIASGCNMTKKGGVFITVRNNDKHEIGAIAKKFSSLGLTIYSTEGTAAVIEKIGIPVSRISKIHEKTGINAIELLESGKVNYVISTSAKGRDPKRDSVKIRRKASLLGIPCLTAIDTANALADSLMSRYTLKNIELVDIGHMRSERLKLNFTKMQTCGNDYIYIDCFEKEIASPEFLSIYLADRHTGVGGDGVVLISKSKVADAKMRMFNLDGSEAKICGNAVRCVAKYLFDNKIVSERELTIETLSGVKLCKVFTKNGIVNRVKVNMGKPSIDPKTVPVNLDGESVINRPVEIGGKQYNITCVSMGNPHCVVFCDETETLDVEALGAEFENSGLFPEGINVEFVQPIEENLIKMRVFERGTGETFACGTGACAAAYAAILNGICDGEKIVKVLARGGELTVRCKPDYITLAGHTEKVFDGTVLV